MIRNVKSVVTATMGSVMSGYHVMTRMVIFGHLRINHHLVGSFVLVDADTND